MASGLRSTARLALAVAGTIISGAAAAQDAPDDGGDIILDPIMVTGTGGGGLAAGRTEGTGLFSPPATNTATKFALTPRETPQSVAVVTNQVIEDFNLTDMKDVLETAPFINVYVERSPGVYVANSRGIAEFNSQFDGIPGSGEIVGRGVIPLDTAFIDRTEIVYGPQGLLVGAGGSGGIINMVRKMPTTEFAASAESTVDQRGSYRLVGDVSGPLAKAGSLRGRLVGVLDKQQSFTDDVWYENNAIYGVIEADVRDGTTVSLGASYADYDAAPGAGYGMPAMVDGSFADLSRSTNLGADWARDKRSGEMVFLKVDQDLPGDWEARGAFNYVNSKQRVTEANPAGPFFPGTDLEYQLFAQKEGWDETAYGLDAYATGTARLFNRTHDLMVGFNAQRIDGGSIGGYSVEGLPGFPGLLQVSYARSHDPSRVPRPSASDWIESWGASDWRTDQIGVYAGGRFTLAEPLHLFLGGRSTRWEWSDGDSEIVKTALTPYAAVTYDFSSWGTVYASYSRIFQPEDWALDANLQPLDPIEGHGYEVGVKGSFYDGRLDASLTLFRLEQENVPEEDLTSPMNCNGWYCYQASGMVKSQGVEIGLAGQITPDWSVLAGYSYWEYVDDKSAAWGNYNPQNLFKVSSTYAFPGDRWTVGGQIRYQSEIYDEGEYDGPYRVEQPGYAIVDLMASYQINEQAALQLNLDNVFDKTYYEGISWPVHGQNFGTPRTASLSLTAAF